MITVMGNCLRFELALSSTYKQETKTAIYVPLHELCSRNQSLPAESELGSDNQSGWEFLDPIPKKISHCRLIDSQQIPKTDAYRFSRGKFILKLGIFFFLSRNFLVKILNSTSQECDFRLGVAQLCQIVVNSLFVLFVCLRRVQVPQVSGYVKDRLYFCCVTTFDAHTAHHDTYETTQHCRRNKSCMKHFLKPGGVLGFIRV